MLPHPPEVHRPPAVRSKPGKVALPPLATSALDQNLLERRLPLTRERWNPKSTLIASLREDEAAGFRSAQSLAAIWLSAGIHGATIVLTYLGAPSVRRPITHDGPIRAEFVPNVALRTESSATRTLLPAST